ncbi:hypothetical protein BDN72DRAFT_180552 [Pluteus cervinus]|uniref:Uncharacterized protein n=1 Tax=Pluteus cervinus TaxID=181527 RepID=A0ACD3AIK9_9AGAR|nr:hypothetical protein BDN72DRAFT_180552 [Pluteus cervinus]
MWLTVSVSVTRGRLNMQMGLTAPLGIFGYVVVYALQYKVKVHVEPFDDGGLESTSLTVPPWCISYRMVFLSDREQETYFSYLGSFKETFLLYALVRYIY